MSRDYELDRLKSEEQSLFQAKQVAWQRWDDAKKRASYAYELSQAAWEERCSAREIMNHEFEAMQNHSAHHQAIWDDYGRIRDYNNSQIEALKHDADYEHQQMCNCFDQASSEYQYGDKAMAPIYSQEGYDHKERRDALNTEISELARQVKEARQNAEWRAPKTDGSDFHYAKEVFERAKERHQRLEAEFKRLKAERDHLKAEFDRLSDAHKRAKEAFQERLAEVKAAKEAKRQAAVDKVNMALVRSNAHYLGSIFGQNAKIVPHSDGTTHVFSVVLGPPTALGMGMQKLTKTEMLLIYAMHGKIMTTI